MERKKNLESLNQSTAALNTVFLASLGDDFKEDQRLLGGYVDIRQRDSASVNDTGTLLYNQYIP